jgi:DNA (cytosine-5)-methyltransferase 1
MRYGSVCSGIEAATTAWHPLGWEAAFFSEIEAFPRAVLQSHYPDTPLHGDFTTIKADQYGSIDLLVGGTPCQSFSIAGLRKGLDDDRGNLALEFLRLAQRTRPTWVVWENVPGVLSSSGGRDFGAFLGGLGELGYGWAYRVLDAQYFGVAQRRRRVFVVGCLGDWRSPAAVLFERHSLQGHPAPSREKGEGAAGYTASSFGQYRAGCGTLRSEGGDIGPGSETLVTGTLTATYGAQSGQDMQDMQDMQGGLQVAPIAFQSNATADQAAAAGVNVSPTMTKNAPNAVAMPINTQIATRGGKMGEGTGFGIGDDGDPGYTLQAAHSHAVAFAENQRGEPRENDYTNALSVGGGKPGQGYQAVREGMAVRRLTPTECERLQGFPDGYTQIPWRNKPVDNCPDGPRYKALGNSMAVPVMRWIGERIQMVNQLEEVTCRKNL